jgi:hypothetical protein
MVGRAALRVAGVGLNAEREPNQLDDGGLARAACADQDIQSGA